MKDVAETLVDEADALGDELEFDAEGNLIRRRSRKADAELSDDDRSEQ